MSAGTSPEAEASDHRLGRSVVAVTSGIAEMNKQTSIPELRIEDLERVVGGLQDGYVFCHEGINAPQTGVYANHCPGAGGTFGRAIADGLKQGLKNALK